MWGREPRLRAELRFDKNVRQQMIDTLDALVCWIIISAAAYQLINAVWVGDFWRMVHVLEVLAAFIAVIVGAHIMGQHLWAG